MTNFEWLVLLLACKATLILALVAGLFALAGRRWPQHCVLWQRLGVVALLALPIAAWVLPTVGIPVLSAPPQLPRSHHAGLAPAADPMAANNEGPATRSGQRSADRRGASPRFAARDRRPTNIGGTTLCLAAVYGLAVVVLMMRFVRSWRGLAQLKRASSPVADPAWQTALEHWSAVLPVGRPVELLVSNAVRVPMTFGWRAPVVLIPNDCLTTCDPTQRDAIVVHELTHIAHGDFFWQTLNRLVAAFYWLHPLVWFIRRQDGALCERICDALCSQHLGRESYAQALVRIAGRGILKPAAALGIPMAQATSLRRRLTDLQSGTASRFSLLNRRQRILLGGVAGLILGLIVVGTLTARTSANAAEGEKSAASAQRETPPDNPTKTPVVSRPLPATLEGQVVDQQDKPVAGAEVTLTVERCDDGGYPTGAVASPPWTVTTNEQGHYAIKTAGLSMSQFDVLHIKTRAVGHPELLMHYFAPEHQLPVQRLPTGRTIAWQITDPLGQPVVDAVVRFQACSKTLMFWDSGPLPVDAEGKFSVAIPKEGKAAVAIYPRDFAPMIVEVAQEETDLETTIGVGNGTALTGRVLDKAGRGVAGTVVAIQSEILLLHMFGIRIATAVKTDEAGNYRLPPFNGIYKVFVTSEAPDYSRRLFVTGAAPPPILPQSIEFDGVNPTQEVNFQEGGSVTVRGTIRWANGSAVADVNVRAETLPAGWESAVPLASARTNSQGQYSLRLPTPAERVILSVSQDVLAPDGKFQPATPVGQPANQRNLEIDLLTEDVNDADWVVGTAE